jgi:nitroimidazol reductase NimA-like FMN-containing flavoprotein (pyridoxamine 5'-phosphate oxidase superfamily)
MDIIKMPKMKKSEYDRLISQEFICRIAFNGAKYPYVAPFLYVFDGKFMYFLSTKYGKKVEHFQQNPLVTVEVERYSKDLSHFSFVAIQGRMTEVLEIETQQAVRNMFIKLIKDKALSPNVLSALGHSPDEPLDALLNEERSNVWKLVGVDVKEITGLRNSIKT